MNNNKIEQAFILAAGFAKRMRPLTDHLPKPLVLLGGRPVLSHIIDELVAVGVNRIVVNGHHCIEKMRKYMPHIQAEHPNIDFILSEEDDILETGGGTVLALNYLDKNKPFYMINGDAYWVSAQNENTLEALQNEWHTSDTDMVLLLQSTDKMAFGKRVGDYIIDSHGKAIRSMNQTGTHMFMGLRILHPRVLEEHKVENFSFLRVMDAVEKNNRLGGYDHKGDWYHISTPEDLENANNTLFKKAS